MTARLRTARLSLWPVTPADAEALAAVRGPDVAGAEARQRHEARIARAIADSALWFAGHGSGLWVFARHDVREVAGWFGVRPRESAAEPELFFGIAAGLEGRGFVSEAGRAIVARLFADPATTGVWSVTDPGHVASLRVMTALGLRDEWRGTFDARDSVVRRLTRAAWDADRTRAPAEDV